MLADLKKMDLIQFLKGSNKEKFLTGSLRLQPGWMGECLGLEIRICVGQFPLCSRYSFESGRMLQ